MFYFADSFMKRVILYGIGTVGCAFIGYAAYFDYKRRSTKEYKEVLRLRKNFQRFINEEQRTTKRSIRMNMNSVGQIFMQEVQLGEEKLAEGFIEDGLIHLSNAISLCSNPQQVLRIFQRTLPDEHFSTLLKALPAAQRRFLRLKELIIN